MPHKLRAENADPGGNAAVASSGLARHGRRWLVRLHRWCGLGIAAFLFIAGVTGSVLAFQHELDAILNPQLFAGASKGDHLSPSRIIARVNGSVPGIEVTSFFFAAEAGATARLGVRAREGSPEPGFNQIFVDPVDGHILGMRKFGACCLEAQNLIPFIWRLHYSLHLPRPWGEWLMGGVALLWLVDCFVGFALTLPVKAAPTTRPSRFGTFWRRWKVAWKLKSNAGRFRKIFDLHRAGGLWLWACLLILAVSSVALNLTGEVARPVVSAISPVTPSIFETWQRPDQRPRERISFDHALGIAQAEAAKRDWKAPVRSMLHSASFGLFGVRFHELGGPGLGQHWLYLDDSSGEIIGARAIGEGSLGDAFMDLQLPLHGGSIAGLPGRILIAITGIGVAMLSVTGVLIWRRKLRPRQRRISAP